DMIIETIDVREKIGEAFGATLWDGVSADSVTADLGITKWDNFISPLIAHGNTNHWLHPFIEVIVVEFFTLHPGTRFEFAKGSCGLGFARLRRPDNQEVGVEKA